MMVKIQFSSTLEDPNCFSKALMFALILLNSLLVIGCGDQKTFSKSACSVPADAALARRQASPQEPTNAVRSFLARGVVRELPPGGRNVIVSHEAIAGFMPKMTMEFSVRDPSELRELRVGDRISFQVKATEEESWIESIRKSSVQDSANIPPPETSAAALLHLTQLKKGDLVPDAEFLAEDGHTKKLSDFKGCALAFTFIFTRCPLPDFCPRMNQQFNRARDLLLQRPGGPTNWQFLSISFDPEFDQPGILSRYAYSYRGQSADRWVFAAAPTNILRAIGPLIDFRFANEGGSFAHNLRTVVLDPKRRIYRQFDGNSWKAQELAQALAEAAMTNAKLDGE